MYLISSDAMRTFKRLVQDNDYDTSYPHKGVVMCYSIEWRDMTALYLDDWQSRFKHGAVGPILWANKAAKRELKGGIAEEEPDETLQQSLF